MFRLSIVVSGAFLLLLLTTPVFAALTVDFETNQIVVRGVTRGGKVVCSSMDRFPPRFVLTTAGVVTDFDHDGAVTIPAKDGYTNRAVFAVVDVESGTYVIANPLGEINANTISAQALRTNSQGFYDRFVADDTAIEALIVRPGEGAWTVKGADGSTGDADLQQDGKFEIQLEGSEPLKSFALAPKYFANRDVIIIMNPRTLEVEVTSVSGVSQ